MLRNHPENLLPSSAPAPWRLKRPSPSSWSETADPPCSTFATAVVTTQIFFRSGATFGERGGGGRRPWRKPWRSTASSPRSTLEVIELETLVLRPFCFSKVFLGRKLFAIFRLPFSAGIGWDAEGEHHTQISQPRSKSDWWQRCWGPEFCFFWRHFPVLQYLISRLAARRPWPMPCSTTPPSPISTSVGTRLVIRGSRPGSCNSQFLLDFAFGTSQALANAMQHNQNLTDLDLDGHHFGAAGRKARWVARS